MMPFLLQRREQVACNPEATYFHRVARLGRCSPEIRLSKAAPEDRGFARFARGPRFGLKGVAVNLVTADEIARVQEARCAGPVGKWHSWSSSARSWTTTNANSWRSTMTGKSLRPVMVHCQLYEPGWEYVCRLRWRIMRASVSKARLTNLRAADTPNGEA